MSERVIDFPAVSEIETARLSGIITNLAEHFHNPIKIEKVTIMRVNYDGACSEMDVILKQLAGDPNGIKVKRVYKNNPKSITFEKKLEPGIDPLGS